MQIDISNNSPSNALAELAEDARRLRALNSALCSLFYREQLAAHKDLVVKIDIALEQVRLEAVSAAACLAAFDDPVQPQAQSSYLDIGKAFGKEKKS